MAEPTLQEVFGAGASQTAASITIQKADLPGLTASANNTAESILVGILVKAKAVLTPENQGEDPLRNVTIEDSFDAIVTRGTTNFRQKTLSVNLQKVDPGAGIDPDDY